MCERRIESHERVQTKAQALEDELAILDDLIHLVAQRAACPDELPPNDAIEHDLMELDGRDAGARLLAAEIH
jgi:hypothetical protein